MHFLINNVLVDWTSSKRDSDFRCQKSIPDMGHWHRKQTLLPQSPRSSEIKTRVKLKRVSYAHGSKQNAHGSKQNAECSDELVLSAVELWRFKLDNDSKSHFSMNRDSLIQFPIESINFFMQPSIRGCVFFAILNPISQFWIKFNRNSILKLNQIIAIDWITIDQFESWAVTREIYWIVTALLPTDADMGGAQHFA